MRLGFAVTIVCIILQFSCGFAEDDSCTWSPTSVTEVDADYGSREAYYDIGQGISKGLQKSLSDSDLNSLGSLWNSEGGVDVSDAVTAFMKVFKKQVGAIIFLVIGAIYIVIMPILGIIFCCLRCKGRCGGKGKKPKFANACSKWSLPIYLSILAVSVALLTVGMIMYGLSIQDTDDNIDYVGEKTKNITEVVMKVLRDGSEQISCSATATVKATVGDTIKKITDLKDATFIKIESKYNISIADQMEHDQEEVNTKIRDASASVTKAIAAVPAAATDIRNKLNVLQATLTSVSTHFDTAMDDVKAKKIEVGKDIANAKEQVNITLANAEDNAAKSQDSVVQSVQHIQGTVNDVNKKIDDISDMLTKVQDNVDTFSGRSAVVHGSKAIVLAPAAFVAFPAFFLLIFGILRVFQNICRLKFLSKFTTAGGYIAAFGLVFAFLFGWIIMLFASVSFFGGFGIEAVCKPLFRDDDMKIFKYIDHLNFNIEDSFDSSKTVTVNFGEILKQCRDNSTIFAAVKGSELINKEAIINKIDLKSSQDKIDKSIEDNNIAFTFNEQDLTNIKGDTESLTTTIQQIDATGVAAAELRDVKTKVNTLIDTLSDYGSRLTELIKLAHTSQSFVNDTKKDVDDLFRQLQIDFPISIEKGVNSLNESTYPCRAVYDVWQTIGVLGCDRLGRPVQGVWTSTGLIAVIYIPTIIVMIIISGILYQIDKKDPYSKHKHGPVEDERAPITQRTHHQRQPPSNGFMYNQPTQPGGPQNNYYYAGNPNHRPASMYPRLTSSGQGQQAQYY